MGAYHGREFLRKGGETLRIHIVQKGDSMWKIAKRYGVDYKELLRLNSQVKTPDTLYPGARVSCSRQNDASRPAALGCKADMLPDQTARLVLNVCYFPQQSFEQEPSSVSKRP